MSSDYRPRPSGGGGGGQRRSRRPRRNGDRSESSPRTQHTPKAKTGIIDKLFGWLFKKEETARGSSTARSNGNGTGSSQRPPRQSSPRAERPEPPATNPEDLTTSKLYVGNLSYDTVESDLFDLFSQAGAVKNVEVVMDRNSNRSKGFGFVELEELSTAKAAVAKFNRTDFMGRQIIVSGAKAERRERATDDQSQA